MAYMRRHPLSPVQGMTPAVVLTSSETGFVNAGSPIAPAACPASLTVALIGSPGPLCGAWHGTAVTASGGVVTLACGSARLRQPCPLLLAGDEQLIPFPGDYIRVRSDGRVTQPGDLQVVVSFAVPGITPESSGSGFAWSAGPPPVPVSVSAQAAASYARAHPVPGRPGTVAAVAVTVDETWTPGASTWAGIAVTATGLRLSVTCTGPPYAYGSPGGVQPGPYAGTYAYWPESGCPHGGPDAIRVITLNAVPAGREQP